MPTTRRRRFGAIAAVLAVLSTLAVLAIGASPARADTTQTYACFSPLTSTYSTFPIPLTGNGSPDPINVGGSTTFSGISATFAIDSNLVVAGIGAGVLNFSTTPAGIGAPDSNPDDGDGGTPTTPVPDGVNAASNTTSARLVTSNTTTAGPFTLNGAVSVTFFIVFDGASAASLQIYVENSPGSWTGSGTGGLHLVPLLPVPIPLSPNVSVTGDADGGSIALSSALSPPANPAAGPTLAERNNAPLVLNNNLGVQANFYCWPGQSQGAPDPITGLPASSPGFTPAASAAAIDTVTVNVPPTPPVCTNETASVGAGQSTLINLADNCTDVNNDINLATLTPTAPTAGTLTPTATPGVFSYQAPATDPGVPVTFSFTVQDLAGQTSNVATASITILGNLCDATAGSCPLSQVLLVPVQPFTRVMEQAGSSVTLIDAVTVLGPDRLPGTPDDPAIPAPAPIRLNGDPQLAVGNLNTITVTNARGDDAGWAVTGQVTSFRTSSSVPVCNATPATWSNHCIPGDNLGWQPSAAVAHQVVLGDVASVTAGSSLPLPPGFYGMPDLQPTGMATGRTLCSSPATHSGGTFTCNAGLALSVPASAAAGLYTATLTLTLA